MSFEDIVDAAVEGSRGAVSVGVSCVVIGVIIGNGFLTGLGLTIGYLILEVVGENQLYLGGLMVMIMSIILGMGVPGVVAYVIVVAVAIPVPIEIGAAHCGSYVLSDICLPVQYYSAGGDEFLRGGRHSGFQSDEDLPACGQAWADRIYPAILFPGKSGTSDWRDGCKPS